MPIKNIIEPSLKIDPIVYNSSGNDELIPPIGKKPFIWFNDIQINLVESFKLISSGFLPTLSITFKDGYGIFDNLRFANDDDRIKVFIDSQSTLLKPVYLEFKVINFRRVGDNIYSLDGMLNINRMYLIKIESYPNSSSFDVMESISKFSGLGYNSNVSGSNDIMNWVNPGDRVMEFCKDVIKRSYISDTSFMWGFVDIYYNLNFIDIESQLKEDVTEQLGIVTTNLNHIQKKLKMSENSEDKMIYLSNDGVTSGTTNYFESYKVYNNSTNKSIQNGYKNRIKYYDWEDKNFLIFDVESINEEDDKNLILKSDDNEFLSENVKHHWEGKMNTNNVHKNYHYSNVQNDMNLNEIQKISMEVVLPIPNFNLFRFMKIYVLIVNQGADIVNPDFNKKLSGGWLISEIIFFMDISGELKQRVKLMRRTLGFSQIEDRES